MKRNASALALIASEPTTPPVAPAARGRLLNAQQVAAVLKVDERLWPWIVAGVPSPLRYKQLRLNWKKACKALKTNDLRLHDLRHAGAQWLADAGVAENRI
jgi:integrase